MRKLFYLLCLIPCLSWAQAEGVNSHVTVHVGENCLADLLTEEQQKGISRLTITGTLEQADYDFLRGERWDGLLGRIDTLDLTDADIDTIPGNAFGWGWNKICLILPKRIKTIGISVPWAFDEINIIVTGQFPQRYTDDDIIYCHPFIYQTKIEASPDNELYVNIRSGSQKREAVGVYSKDRDTLYYLNMGEEGEIPEGTKVIAGYAFMGMCFANECLLVLPSSIDSIGDYAFAYMEMEYITSLTARNRGYLICKATEPPALGADVFKNSVWGGYYMYVPKESLEKYRKAPGWGDLLLHSIDEMDKYSSITEQKSLQTGILIEAYEDAYRLTSPQHIVRLTYYDTAGRLLSAETIDSPTAYIRKDALTMPYTIVRAHLEDGTHETIKLKP